MNALNYSYCSLQCYTMSCMLHCCSEERHLDAVPPEPVLEKKERKEVTDGLQQAPNPYNNIVTGVMSDSYLDRASHSSTPSKMSAHTGVSNVSNGRAAGMGPVQAPPRSRSPSQGYPYGGSRPDSRSGTPAQGVTRTVNYSTNPGQGQAELTLTVKAQPPGGIPYQYQPGRQSPYGSNHAGDNYYARRYAPSPSSQHDSEV